jgi:hypothetical protein
MQLLKVSDFCRKFQLPHHRFSRYKKLFHTQKVEGYVKPWVKVDQWNLEMVADILEHTGTRRRRERLSLEDFCSKYGLTTEHFKKVCHRMNLEDHEGQLMVVDTKHNYALLKYGRLIRKKI